MGTHVGYIPNWHTFNATSFDNAFSVAALGAFGYEFDITTLDEKNFCVIKKQIEFYKKWREVLQFGTLYVNESVAERGISSYTVVDEEKRKAVATVIVTERIINHDYPKIYIKGLDPDTVYNVSYREQAEYDDLPDFTASGSALGKIGIPLGNMFGCKSVAGNYNSIQTKMLTFEKI